MIDLRDRGWLVVLHQYEGMSAEEIADVVGCRPRKVREHLSAQGVGTTRMLLREEATVEALVDYHGSPAKAAEATGVAYTRIMAARP